MFRFITSLNLPVRQKENGLIWRFFRLVYVTCHEYWCFVRLLYMDWLCCAMLFYLVGWDINNITWWHHQMETFSTLLAIYAGNSPVTGEFPAQKASDAGLWYFLLICAWINCWVKNSETGHLRRHGAHYDVIVMIHWDMNLPWESTQSNSEAYCSPTTEQRLVESNLVSGVLGTQSWSLSIIQQPTARMTVPQLSINMLGKQKPVTAIWKPRHK